MTFPDFRSSSAQDLKIFTARESAALLGCLLLTAAVYWGGLAGPLIVDDTQNLLPVARWLVGETSWWPVVFGNESGIAGRPVSMASFVVNAAVMGPEIRNFKLFNLVLHLGNGLLVFFLFRQFLRLGGLTREVSRTHRWLPLFGAAIWLLHPLLVSTVLYVVQRMAMLSAFFVFASMLIYVQGRLDLRALRRGRALFLLAVALPVSAAAAFFSKENGVLAIPLCGLIEWMLFSPKEGRSRSLGSVVVIVVSMVVPATLVLGLTLLSHDLVMQGYANRPFSLTDRLLTQPRVLWDYVASSVLPNAPRLGLFHDDYPVSRSIVDPVSTLLALIGWTGFAGAAMFLRRRIPGLALGLGIFLIGHSLESSVFPLLMYFEHRNYLPLVGLIWMGMSLAGSVMPTLSQRVSHPRALFALLGMGLVLTLAAATATQAVVWSSEASILDQGLRHHPDSRWVRVALGDRAMKHVPPRVDDARLHAQRLALSRDAVTRRFGALLQLNIDCASGVRPDAGALSGAFDGFPDPIEADMVVAFESLIDRVLAHPCDGMTYGELAERLVAMLDRSHLDPGEIGIWRLRMGAARLMRATGRRDSALQQARLAMAGLAAAPPMPMFFIAGLQIDSGDLAAASTVLDELDKSIPQTDSARRKVLRQYREDIHRMNKIRSSAASAREP